MGVAAPLQLLFASIAVFFVLQGWIPVSLLPFPLLASLYIFLLSRHTVPPLTSKSEPGLFDNSRPLKYYRLFAATIGLLLPLLYTFYTFYTGDVILAKVAAPSLFLLIIQVLSENYTYRNPGYSVLTRPLVAMVYNTRRLFSIWEEMVFLFGSESGSAVWFGRVIAVVNYVFWNWNLFGFLIPVFLVRSMRQYCDLERAVKQK